MKSTLEVIKAVREGTEVSEEELKFAIMNLNMWSNRTVLVIARILTACRKGEIITCKSIAGLEEAWTCYNNNVMTGPLDRIRGTCIEPGIGRMESMSRRAEDLRQSAIRLFQLIKGEK